MPLLAIVLRHQELVGPEVYGPSSWLVVKASDYLR